MRDASANRRIVAWAPSASPEREEIPAQRNGLAVAAREPTADGRRLDGPSRFVEVPYETNLDRAFEAHDVHLVFLPVDVKWDTFRSHERFQALLKRYRLVRSRVPLEP